MYSLSWEFFSYNVFLNVIAVFAVYLFCCNIIIFDMYCLVTSFQKKKHQDIDPTNESHFCIYSNSGRIIKYLHNQLIRFNIARANKKCTTSKKTVTKIIGVWKVVSCDARKLLSRSVQLELVNSFTNHILQKKQNKRRAKIKN